MKYLAMIQKNRVRIDEMEELDFIKAKYAALIDG